MPKFDVSYNIVTLRVDPMVVSSINLYWNHQFELAALSNISQKRHIGTHVYEQVALTIDAIQSTNSFAHHSNDMCM
jgi:hypothetical protein